MAIRACKGYGFAMSMSLLKAMYQLNEPLMATFTILKSIVSLLMAMYQAP